MLRRSVILAVCLLSLVSCGKRAQEAYPVSDYVPAVELSDGDMYSGIVVYPVLSVAIDGPDERVWKVSVTASGLQPQWFSVATGTSMSRRLSLDSVSPGDESVSYSVRIYDQASGQVLYNATLTASLKRKVDPEEIADDTERRFVSLQVVTEGGTVQIPITDGAVSGTVSLQEGCVGRFEVRFSPASGRETFKSGTEDAVSSGAIVLKEVVFASAGSFSVPFSTGAPLASGELYLAVLCGGNSWRLSVPFEVVASAGPEPGPTPEPTYAVSLLAPAAAFEGKTVPVTAHAIGFGDTDLVDVTLYLDGAAYATASQQRASVPIVFTVGEDGSLSRGTHRLSVALSSAKAEEPVSSVEVRLPVYGMSYRWTAGDGGSCQAGLKSRSQTSRFFFDVETSYPEDLLGEVTLKDKTSGSVFRQDTPGGKRLTVQKLSRGLHEMELRVSNEAGEYSWNVEVKCFDLYGVELYVSGNDLLGKVFGPGSSLPSRVWVEMGAMVGAYIPYTEAVGSAGAHVTEPKGQYIDLEYYKRQYEFPKGSSCSTITLESGYVSKVVKHVKEKASGVKATVNGASRWVESGGTWRKETYTPKVYPCLTLSFWGTITGAQMNEYVLFDIDTSKIREYLEKEDMRLVVSIPYWN